jgi:peroxiredoxin Q/BCP
MPKKTRKKSPKSPAGKTTRGPSRTKPEAAPSKSGRPAANQTSKTAKLVQAGNSRSKGSHEPASKKLRAAGAAKTYQAVAEGTQAPSFRLPRDDGSTVSLSDFAGKKLVVFFYPRADTPGCTKEAIDFTRLSHAFAECGTALLGVSADPPRAQAAFRNKHRLGVPLASDERHEMLKAYGAWGAKSMYGRTFEGIHRTTILIGKDGRIARIWRNVRVDGHAEEVLAAACTD